MPARAGTVQPEARTARTHSAASELPCRDERPGVVRTTVAGRSSASLSGRSTVTTWPTRWWIQPSTARRVPLMPITSASIYPASMIRNSSCWLRALERATGWTLAMRAYAAADGGRHHERAVCIKPGQRLIGERAATATDKGPVSRCNTPGGAIIATFAKRAGAKTSRRERAPARTPATAISRSRASSCPTSSRSPNCANRRRVQSVGSQLGALPGFRERSHVANITDERFTWSVKACCGGGSNLSRDPFVSPARHLGDPGHAAALVPPARRLEVRRHPRRGPDKPRRTPRSPAE
jgi:hypothetical protein